MIEIDIEISEQFINYVINPFIIHMIVYWGLSIFFAFMDYYLGKKGILYNYKTQSKPIRWDMYPKTVKRVLLNQFFFSLPLQYLLMPYSINLDTPEYDWFPIMVFKIIISVLVSDLSFYLAHRSMHHKLIYKYIHKTHHEWKAPVACRALYTNPIEHIFGNILPVLIPFYILQNHWDIIQFFMIMTTINTVVTHSGYSYHGFNQEHDKHHEYFNVNYGAMVWDYIFRTHHKQYLNDNKLQNNTNQEKRY